MHFVVSRQVHSVLHRVQSDASSFNIRYPFVFLRPSSGCLCLLPRLPVIVIIPSVFSNVV